MKIAFLIERLAPARGGAERYSWDFTAMLAAAGHEVHVFARSGSSAPPGVTLEPVKGSGIGRAWRTLSYARRVEKMLAREDFDVIHGTGWTWSQDVFQPHGGVYLANREARGAGGRWDALCPRQRTFRRIERRQYTEQPALVYVALSQKVRRDMRRFYDVPDEKIRVVYNGVDVERFHPRDRGRFRAEVRRRHGIGEEEVVFLIVAHNFELKGVPELVACVTEPGFPPCRVLVVGKGKPGGLTALAESRAPGRVIFAGAVDDAAPYYAAVDAYAHPTHYDPCSLTVLEALAAGLPVMTTTVNGAGELMMTGREGFVIAPGEPRALGEAMNALLDASRRKTMGEAARTLAENHTLGYHGREMTAVYEEIIRLKGRS